MQPALLRYFLITPLYLTASLLSQNFEVISGTATSTQSGNLTTIENSPHAILHWDDFSIPQQNHLHFAQVSAASTVLNRVTGHNVSALMGTLTSNGQVYLLNPNGVLIGPNAVIATAGFLASTAHLSNDEFLAGNELSFSLFGEGKIINQGSIQCEQGNIFLIATDVLNEGTCSADTINIGSGIEVLVQPNSAQRLYIRPDPIPIGEVVNSGILEAVVMELRSSSAYEKAIRVEGAAAKLTASAEGGRIILSAESGGVEIEGSIAAAGGEVHLLGKQVTLSLTAQIDVSARSGGGTVLIGGDYQGKNPDVLNAQTTFMHEGAEIKADALLRGDGGKVILWADDATVFNGDIFARGGPEGGNGGFVETSGKETLSVQTGFVNTSAANGKFGDWLLDPNTLVIATGGLATIAQCSSPNCGDATAQTIDPSTLNAAMSNVSLCSQNAVGSSITISNNIALTTSGAGLTLTAGSGSAGSISIGANITTAGGALTFNGNVDLGLAVNRSIDTTNGGANPAGADIFFLNTIAAGVGNTTQTFTLNAGTGGTVTFTGVVGNGLQWSTTTVSNAGTINLLGGASGVQAVHLASFTAQTQINLSADIAVNAVSGTSNINLNGPVVFTGNRTLQASGGMANQSTISLSGSMDGSGSLTLRTGLGTVFLAGNIGGTTPPSNLTVSNSLFLHIGNTPSISITVSGANPLTFSPQVTMVGLGATLTTNNNNLTFSSSVAAANNGTNPLTIDTGTGVTTFSNTIGVGFALGAISVTSTNATGLVFSTNTVSAASLTTSATATRFAFAGTTNVTTTASGTGISFGGAVSGTVANQQALIFAAGSGTVNFGGNAGSVAIPLSSLSATTTNTTASALSFGGTTYQTNGAQSYTTGVNGLINVSGTVGFTTNNNGITFASGTMTPAASSVVTLTAGSGAISIAPVNGGATTTLNFANTGTLTTTGGAGTGVTIGTLNFNTNPSSISLGGNVTTLTSGLTFPVAVTLTANSVVTTTNQPLQFSSTINGARTLSLASGTGTITLSTSLTTAPLLSSLSLTSSNTGTTAVNLNGTTYTTTGAQSYTAGANGKINVSGMVGFNTTNSPITFSTGTLSPTAASVVTLTAGSGAISIGPVNGDNTTTLHYINTGTATTTGAVTIGTLDFTLPSSISIGNNITVLTSDLTFPAPTTITATSVITTSVGSISITNPFTWATPFNLTLSGAHAVTVTNTNITSSGTGASAGNLTIQANGTGAGSFAGIALSNSTVSTADGALALTGTGGSTGDNNHGIDILLGSVVSTTGSGAMTLSGTGGNGGNFNYGIHLDMGSATAVAGTISLTGSGNGTGTNNYGIFLASGSVVQSTGATPNTLSCGPAMTAATICLVGQGSSLGSSNNEGILMTGMGTTVTSAAGPVSIQGFGGGTTTTNTGVQIDTGAQVTSTTTAPISISGTAGPGADSWGIQISGTNSKINSLIGGITLLGTGGTAGNGIEVTNTGRVTGTLAAPIILQTLNNSDLLISSNAIIETLLGSLTVTTSRDLILLGGVNPLEVALLRFATNSTFTIGRDIVITGGSGMGTLARIEALAASIANFSLGRHLTLTGGSNTGASASIEPLFSSSVLQFGNMTNLTLIGGTGTDAYAQIGSSLTTATGNITFTSVSGNVLLDASTGNSHVAIGHGQHTNTASILSGDISVIAAGDISLLGSNASANGFVQIGHVNQTAGGSTLSGNITVQSTNGTISLLGGSANAASYAQIGLGGQVGGATYGASTLQLTAHDYCSFTSISGAGPATVISPGTGNITILASGIGSGTYAGILADGALIQCNSGTISLTGTGGNTGANNSGIHLSNAANVTSALGTGNITMTGNGGPGTTGNHGILADTNSLVATSSGSLSATGTGTNSDGLQINGATYTSVDGPQTFIGTATGILIDNRGIAVLNGGVVSSTGVAGTGTISMTGTGSTNGTTGNHGILVTDATTSITSVTGNVSLSGTGNGSGINNRGISIENAASVSSTGSASLTLAGTGGTTATNSWGVLLTGASTLVSSTGGAITLNGTAGGSTAEGTRITSGAQVTSAGSGTVTLATFNTSDLSVDKNAVVITTASAPITINSSRDLLIAGGTNMNEAARIDCDANGILSITTSRDLVLTGGSNTSTSAQIQNNAPGNAFFTIGRDLILTGGTGSGAEAGIHPTGPTSSLLFGIIGRDLTLTSGSGLNATAHIGSFQTIEDAQILFGMIDGNVTLTATDTNSFAAIGHGLPGNAVSSLSGYINFPFVMGDVTLQGANAGAGTQGFAQIGHIDQISQSSTLTGDITINNLGSITLNGGTAATSARAQIGPGGQSMTTIFGAGTELLTAGVNCSLQGVMGFGEAIITNPAGDLTIVVDNLFPTAPSIGPGAFIFGSTLIATGNLKIYTATQSQNNVPTGSTINGQMYSPGPEFVDSPTEEWDTYYPSGSYGGASFKFYYKNNGNPIPPTPPTPPAPPPNPSLPVIANQGSLADLIRSVTARIPYYLITDCNLWMNKRRMCALTYSSLVKHDENFTYLNE